ncbi:MAG: hypothetical protein FWD83_02235 [Promicromonosporaceae bacterium]|nr:hypothetical protein [Promicromonosporaceae bacterium]
MYDLVGSINILTKSLGRSKSETTFTRTAPRLRLHDSWSFEHTSITVFIVMSFGATIGNNLAAVRIHVTISALSFSCELFLFAWGLVLKISSAPAERIYRKGTLVGALLLLTISILLIFIP